MSIDPQRLAAAMRVFEQPRGYFAVTMEERLVATLAADDLYRSTHKESLSVAPTPPPMTEPTLPPRWTFTCGRYLFNGHDTPEVNCCEVHELETIALHMRWRQNQRTREQEAKAEPPWEAAFAVLRNQFGIEQSTCIANAIILAEAQRSEARKESV